RADPRHPRRRRAAPAPTPALPACAAPRPDGLRPHRTPPGPHARAAGPPRCLAPRSAPPWTTRRWATLPPTRLRLPSRFACPTGLSGGFGAKRESMGAFLKRRNEEGENGRVGERERNPASRPGVALD